MTCLLFTGWLVSDQTPWPVTGAEFYMSTDLLVTCWLNLWKLRCPLLVIGSGLAFLTNCVQVLDGEPASTGSPRQNFPLTSDSEAGWGEGNFGKDHCE